MLLSQSKSTVVFLVAASTQTIDSEQFVGYSMLLFIPATSISPGPASPRYVRATKCTAVVLEYQVCSRDPDTDTLYPDTSTFHVLEFTLVACTCSSANHYNRFSSSFGLLVCKPGVLEYS